MTIVVTKATSSSLVLPLSLTPSLSLSLTLTLTLSHPLSLSRPGSHQLLAWPIDSIDQRPTATLPQEQPGARFTVAAIADNLTFVGPQVRIPPPFSPLPDVLSSLLSPLSTCPGSLTIHC